MAQLTMSMTHFVSGQPDEAIAAAEEAIRQNPSLVNAYAALGLALTAVGRAEEALAAIEKGMRLSPRDPVRSMSHFAGAFAHFAIGHYEEAADWARRSLRDVPRHSNSLRVLAASCAHLGQLDEARAIAQEHSRLHPDWSLSAFKPILLAAMKDPELIERYFDGLRKAGIKE
jgi:tetratricopeptide (TPR) repeat protein